MIGRMVTWEVEEGMVVVVTYDGGEDIMVLVVN